MLNRAVSNEGPLERLRRYGLSKAVKKGGGTFKIRVFLAKHLRGFLLRRSSKGLAGSGLAKAGEMS